MSQVCVVHLVRRSNGVGPLRRFVDSYRAHPAGVPHDLLVLLKGFRGSRATADVADALRDVPHDVRFVPDTGFDIGPYFDAAQRLATPYVCFLNSFSVVLADDWLAKLHGHVVRDGVGLVGATGSWESILSGAEGATGRVPWHWRISQGLWFTPLGQLFAPFPNPHVRTNGFMIARETILRVGRPRLDRKLHAHRFESGRGGLSDSVRAMGLQLLVVGRDGRAYGPDEWNTSGTFRDGGQENLLVADNQTNAYAEADPARRALLAASAWGAKARNAPR